MARIKNGTRAQYLRRAAADVEKMLVLLNNTNAGLHTSTHAGNVRGLSPNFIYFLFFHTCISNLIQMKKCPCRETQTLRAGYSKTEPKIFAPPQTPFPGAHAGRPKLNQLEMVATVIVVTEPTHRRNLLQCTLQPLSLARSVMIFKFQTRVAICGVHMAESLLVGRNFVSGV